MMELIPANEEGFNVPSSGSVSADRTYYVVDLDIDIDAETVYDFLAEELPRTYGGLPLTGFAPRRIGKGLYSVKADYGVTAQSPRTNLRPTQIETNTGDESYVFSFSTTGGTVHITEAIQQTRYVFNNDTQLGEDIGTKLNFNGQEVEGIDVINPAMNFTIRKRKAGNLISLAYVNLLVSLTGKMNAGIFLGFKPGELLFAGAEGQQVRGGDTEITFSFVAKPNLTNYTIANTNIGDVKGHDYVWTYYKPGFSGQRAAAAVCKATIYDSGDFNLLGAT